MPRASWRGFLRLSLVSCPIYLSPATTRTKPIRLHQGHIVHPEGRHLSAKVRLFLDYAAGALRTKFGRE